MDDYDSLLNENSFTKNQSLLAPPRFVVGSRFFTSDGGGRLGYQLKPRAPIFILLGKATG